MEIKEYAVAGNDLQIIASVLKTPAFYDWFTDDLEAFLASKKSEKEAFLGLKKLMPKVTEPALKKLFDRAQTHKFLAYLETIVDSGLKESYIRVLSKLLNT